MHFDPQQQVAGPTTNTQPSQPPVATEGGVNPTGEAPQEEQKIKLPKPPKMEVPESVQAAVKKWTKKITAAKKKFEPDFLRMKDNMEFVAGLQWPEQKDLNDNRYVANIVLREINQGVASLYARNPKATAKRRERIEHTIWDGKPETLVQAAQAMGGGQGGANPMAMAVIQDFIQCEQKKQLTDLIAETLEKEYQIQIDRMEPDFKLSMKQVVRRVKVTGVGYARAIFKREERLSLSPSQTEVDIPARLKMLHQLTADYDDQKFDDNNAKYEQIRQLVNSVQYSMSNPAEVRENTESLCFDFPPATSIIVDPHCRMLKGFVGANWVVQEFIMPLDFVKAYFEREDLKTGSGENYAKSYTVAGTENPPSGPTDAGGGAAGEVYVCVWEVFDKTTRSRFYLCDGYNNYLLEPEEPKPCVQRFWPIIALTFNDTESEPGLKVSVYPPSDVDLLRSPQQEWNKAKQGLREHRRSNRPNYASPVGALSDEDKNRLGGDYPVGAVIEVNGLAPGQDVGHLLQPIEHSPITPELYATEPLERDIQLVSGAQQAVLGPISKRGTATEATISEQSRMSSTGSNVDDIDDFLSEMARVGSEMLLREMSTDVVKRDVGPGAVWPEANREEFVDRVYLTVEAASTGRPNKGLEIANFERLAPLLQAAGANPVFLVREGVKRLDDRLDVNEAFPLVPIPPVGMAMAQAGGPAAGPANGPGTSPSAVPNQTAAGPAQPLPAATDAAMSNSQPQ